MDKDIENYNSFYSLLTVAAVNGYRLTVTTSNRINRSGIRGCDWHVD